LSTSGADPELLRQRAREWLEIAATDRRGAAVMLDADPPLIAPAAYHCQQAAEKVLKSLLVGAGIFFRHTHDLDALGKLVAARHPALVRLVEPLAGWSRWAVAYRYPAESGPEPEPSIAELRAALEDIDRLAVEARQLIERSATDDKDAR
jgi:HEPN domain-containing protein